MQNNYESEPQISKIGNFSQINQTRSRTSIEKTGKVLKVPLDLKNLETRSSLNFQLSPAIINSFPARERALSQKEIVEKITDFKDKVQIWEAVNHPNTTREKIKVIDAVIQRREEIAEKKRRKRALKATTLLPTLVPKFKRDLQPTNIINKFRKSTIDLNLEDPVSSEIILQEFPSPGIRSLQTRIGTFIKNEKEESETSDSSEESVKLVFPMEVSPELKLRLAASMPSSKLRTAGNSPIHSSKLEGSHVFFNFDERKMREGPDSPEERSYSPKRRFGFLPSEVQSHDVSPNIRNQSRRTSIAKNFENLNSIKINDQMTPSSSHFSRHRNFGTKSFGNFSQVKNTKNIPNDDAYNIAGKKFEKELYRFLLVNKNKDESQAIVNSSPVKRRKMRKIEEKVFSQFEKNVTKQENLGYFLSNLLQTKLAKLEKEKNQAISGFSKKFPLQLFGVDIEKKKAKPGKKSSSLVRKIDPQSIENLK